jgi:hypothetical protein
MPFGNGGQQAEASESLIAFIGGTLSLTLQRDGAQRTNIPATCFSLSGGSFGGTSSGTFVLIDAKLCEGCLADIVVL